MSKRSSVAAISKNPSAGARWKNGLMAVGVASFFLNILLLTGPFYMLQIYDRVLSSQSLATLLALSLLVAVLFVIYGLLDFIRSRLMARVSSLFDLSFAERSFNSSVDFRSNSQTDQLSLRDLRCVQQFLMSPAATNLFDVPWFPIYILAIYLLHPLLSAVALAGSIVLIILATINALRSRSPERAAHNYASEEDQLVAACKQDADVVHAMGMLPSVARQWRNSHRNLLSATRASSDRNSPLTASSRTVRLIVQSAILGFGAYLVIGSSLSAGALIAASIMFGRALAPMDSAIANWRNITTAMQSWARLKESLRRVCAKQTEMSLKKPTKTLNVQNLTIAAENQQRPIISNVSFELKAGDALAIVGPSGGGKSTLLRGVLGVLAPSVGSSRLDGATLDQWGDAERGEVVGYLPQNVRLFDGTLVENICRFKDPIDSDAVLRAAELCGVHNLITQLPDGYNTQVGPSGYQLSSGQVQRIGLARAIYGAPFLVVMDEPNAHLDAEGEALLNKTIGTLRSQGSIVLIAAHRKSALEAANKALILVDGEMKNWGDRDTVLNWLPKPNATVNGGLRVVGS